MKSVYRRNVYFERVFMDRIISRMLGQAGLLTGCALFLGGIPFEVSDVLFSSQVCTEKLVGLSPSIGE